VLEKPTPTGNTWIPDSGYEALFARDDAIPSSRGTTLYQQNVLYAGAWKPKRRTEMKASGSLGGSCLGANTYNIVAGDPEDLDDGMEKQVRMAKWR
jgi:hypothetical protein